MKVKNRCYDKETEQCSNNRWAESFESLCVYTTRNYIPTISYRARKIWPIRGAVRESACYVTYEELERRKSRENRKMTVRDKI